jgi:serine/threonine protein kinase
MGKIETKFEGAIQHQDASAIATLIHKNCGKKITPAKIESIAKKLHYSPLEHALASCQKMQKLPGTGVGEKDLLEIAFFIETKLKGYIDKGEYSLKKDKTGLSRSIEYDPKSKLTFIHLKCHNGVKKLGGGVFKTVTKSIQYDREKPELVAHAEQKGDASQEVHNLKKAHDIKGVIQAKAIINHEGGGSSENKVSMLFKLFSPGALSETVIKSFSFQDKVKIAKDLITGLKGLHETNLVHRDIKRENIFVDKKGSDVKAVIADLGQGCSTKEAKGKIPNATRLYAPPEAFNDDLKKIDYKKSDVFSLACVIYELVFEKRPEWMKNEHFAKAQKDATSSEKKALKKSFSSQVKSLQEDLQKKIAKKEKNSKKAGIMKALIEMFNANPDKRANASDALKLVNAA